MSLGKRLINTGAAAAAAACPTETADIFGDSSGVALYSLDYDASDESGTYDGTPTNVEFGVGGQINYGARFNGSSSYIALGTNTPLNNYNGEQTISVWIYPTTAIQQTIIGYRNDSTTKWNTLRLNSNNTLSFLLRSLSYLSTPTTVGTVNLNAWNHVCVTIDSSNITFYINNGTGEAFSNVAFSNHVSSFTSSEPTDIGRRGSFSNQYFNGSIDQVRIFTKSLSSNEVSTLNAEDACVHTSTTDIVNYPTGTTPVAYYKLDNSSEDYSTGGDDGTDTNVEDTLGKFGQAAVFSGNGYISGLPTVENTSGEFSVSLWFNTTVNPSVQHTMLGGIKEQGTNDSVVALKMTSDGYSKLYVRGTDGTLHILADTVDATDGNWHHLVGTVNSSSAILYVDGSQVDTATISNNITVDNLLIGAENNRATLNPTNYFNGSIDQVRIYDAALTSSQATELYNEKHEVDTSNFKTVLYKGTGVTQSISNVGIDLETNGGLVWTKSRDNAYDHNWVDSVRGINPNGTLFALSSNEADEQTDSVNNVLSLDANGFTVQNAGSRTNTNNQNYVSWVWKGGGDAVSNTDGSITSQVSANTTAGFSIVKYTGNGDNDFQDVGTGLSQECDIVFIKNLTSFNTSWVVQRNKTDTSKYLYLNDTRRESSSFAFEVDINTNEGTFGFTSDNRGVNEQGDEYIAYCWHSVSGYSQIGSYSGSSSTVTISTGFEPSLLIIKRIDATGGSWYMFDNKRSISPDNDDFLKAEDFDNETLNETDHPMFYSDRIEILSGSEGINDNFNSYIYMTFK